METSTAPTQAAPIAATSSGPDLSNMTGEQAKAWVEAQKQKSTAKNPAKKVGEDPYFADKPKQSSESTVKEAAAEAKRRLKIDDEEVDEEEVIKTYKQRRQHQQAANRELHEGKTLRKQAEEFVSMLKDPQKFWEVAKKMGHDPRTLSEKLLVTHIEEEMLTPEQKAQRERDRELEEYRADRKKRDQEAEEAKQKQKRDAEEAEIQILRERFAKDYTEQFTKALSETNLPPTKQTVAAMARYIADAAKIKFKMTAKEAAQLVKEDILETQRRLLGDSDGEALINLLGEDVANKVRKWDTGRLRNPNPPRVAAEDQGKPRERRAPHKRMSPKEWREFNRR